MAQCTLLPASSDTVSLPPITYKGQPVVTTERLAQVYGCDPKQIRQNFANNKERFVEGKHFFSLTGRELNSFRLCVENFDSQISSKVRNLTLYTERGSLQHAKSIGTDETWAVYDVLVETFFRVVKPEPQSSLPEIPDTSAPLAPSTADDRKPLRSLVFAWSRTAGVHVDTCWPQVKAHFQLTRLDDLPVEWIPDALAFVQGKIDEVPKALPESNVTLSREAVDYLIHKKLEEIIDGKISLKDARMAISGLLKAGQIVPAKGQPPVVLMEDQMEERFLELKDAAKDVKLKTNRFMHGVYARVLMVPDDKRNIASRMFVTLDKQWQSINTAIDAMEEHAKAMCCLNRVL